MAAGPVSVSPRRAHRTIELSRWADLLDLETFDGQSSLREMRWIKRDSSRQSCRAEHFAKSAEGGAAAALRMTRRWRAPAKPRGVGP
jgi:hypothetical protein